MCRGAVEKKNSSFSLLLLFSFFLLSFVELGDCGLEFEVMIDGEGLVYRPYDHKREETLVETLTEREEEERGEEREREERGAGLTPDPFYEQAWNLQSDLSGFSLFSFFFLISFLFPFFSSVPFLFFSFLSFSFSFCLIKKFSANDSRNGSKRETSEKNLRRRMKEKEKRKEKREERREKPNFLEQVEWVLRKSGRMDCLELVFFFIFIFIFLSFFLSFFFFLFLKKK